MEAKTPEPVRRSSVWVWVSAEDGTRWRINHTREGIFSCPIGLGGKRVGPWKAGLPPSLDAWPTYGETE